MTGYFGHNIDGIMSDDLKKDKYALLSNGWLLSECIFHGIPWMQNIYFSALFSAADVLTFSFLIFMNLEW